MRNIIAGLVALFAMSQIVTAGTRTDSGQGTVHDIGYVTVFDDDSATPCHRIFKVNVVLDPLRSCFRYGPK